MSVATTWMDLETVILSEVRHREISHDIIYMQNFKKKDVTNTLLYLKWMLNEDFHIAQGVPLNIM